MSRVPIGPVLDKYEAIYVDRCGWQKINCPVHNDTRPSCSLNLESNHFECHACGVSGGAVELVMAKENVDFETAFRIAEEISGTGGRRVRGGTGWRSGRTLPGQQGYRPRSLRKAPSRLRIR